MARGALSSAGIAACFAGLSCLAALSVRRPRRVEGPSGVCVGGPWESRLQAATKLALAAGAAMLAALEESKSLVVTYKGQHDLVTETDRANECLIQEGVLSLFPEDDFVGEEGCADEDDGGAQRPPDLSEERATWIVDPIDGTTNFCHGFPVTCVSIAMAKGGEVLVGVVYNPLTGELYQACRGRGAFLNGRRMSASGCTRMDRSVIVTEYSYLRGESSMRAMLDTTRRVLARARAVRQTGCGAMDLCYLARGAVDAVYGGVEGVWKPWDWAAGVVIAEEAGARVTDGAGDAFELMGKTILAAATPALASEVLEAVGPSLAAP